MPGVIALVVVSAGWLAYEFWRLLFQPGVMGAVDLLLRYDEVHRWFAGLPVYTNARTATYPPASLVMLWPFVGWLSPVLTRWLWAALSAGSLVWLAWLLVRSSGAGDRTTRSLIVLLPLSTYAAGAAIGNGQLIVLVLPALLAAIFLLRSDAHKSWPWHLLAAALLVATLVKPTLAAPFFWIVLFTTSAIWPTLLAATAYVGLTLFAVQFQPTPAFALMEGWLANSQETAVGSSGANLHAWLSALGAGNWISLASIVVLLALGTWIYRYRHADIWLLLGVTGIVANLWSYHLWYDDLVLVLPAISLFRLASSATSRSAANLATALLAAWIIADLAPGGLYTLPAPWNSVYVAGQTLLRAGVLLYLLEQTRRHATGSPLVV